MTGLQAHEDLWAVVGSLGIVEFAQGPTGHQAPRATETQRRSRLTEDQKSAAVVSSGLTPAGITRADLPIIVRQSMHELVVEGEIHIISEKRLMKYLAGPPSQAAK